MTFRHTLHSSTRAVSAALIHSYYAIRVLSCAYATPHSLRLGPPSQLYSVAVVMTSDVGSEKLTKPLVCTFVTLTIEGAITTSNSSRFYPLTSELLPAGSAHIPCNVIYPQFSLHQRQGTRTSSTNDLYFFNVARLGAVRADQVRCETLARLRRGRRSR